jgi:hypothetical protein
MYHISNIGWGTFAMFWYPEFVAPIKPPTNKHLGYPTYVKDTNLDVHI